MAERVPRTGDVPQLIRESAPVFPLGARKRKRTSEHRKERHDQDGRPSGTLWYGDNLEILRDNIPSESTDLVYLDPPFNSNRAYNVIFKGPAGAGPPSQIQAFDDTWTWSDRTNHALASLATTHMRTHRLVAGLVDAHGTTDLAAYLVMMAVRLVELHRVLKPTGSLYLHCDPTASHYLKIILDAIFGAPNFRNEIVWKRTNARSTDGRWPRVHDILLFYSKSDDFLFRPLKIPANKAQLPHTLITGPDGKKYQTYELTAPGVTLEGESGRPWRGFDPTPMGRHWANDQATLDSWAEASLIHWPKNGGFPRRRAPEIFKPESRLVTVGDVWTDIDRINQSAKERMGFPTQKPLALLDRIITASTKPGDMILDPFCGCGTAVVSAENLGRSWIGIDITSLAIGVIEKRFDELFEELTFQVKGVPTSRDDAAVLAQQDAFQFQWWAASRIEALPYDGRNKKGPDRGIDGVIPFFDDNSGVAKRCIVSVKSGRNIGPTDVRDLHGTVEANKAETGVLVTLYQPTPAMRAAAAQALLYHSPTGHDYPRIQILTVEDILADKLPDLPGMGLRKRKRRISAERVEQQRLPAWG